jgi:hypothetical protein
MKWADDVEMSNEEGVQREVQMARGGLQQVESVEVGHRVGEGSEEVMTLADSPEREKQMGVWWWVGVRETLE